MRRGQRSTGFWEGQEYIEKLIAEKDIDGVFYHVLKGQIEYDFEFTKSFAKKAAAVSKMQMK